MDRQAYLELIQAKYKPKHEALYRLGPKMFAPTYLRALVGSQLPSVLQEVGEGVYTFELFRQETCRMLLEEAHHFEHFREEHASAHLGPNSMNRYGVVLDDFGLGPSLTQLIRLCVAPLSQTLYADVGGGSLDGHHGFVVSYDLGRQESLDFHVDDSEVTLNVCLGEEFEGGDLLFQGVRCAEHQSTRWLADETVQVAHRPGQAILHLGRHRHEALPIQKGRRRNLILWCSSAEFRKKGARAPRCRMCAEQD